MSYNKYGNQYAYHGGKRYDSKFEASVAQDLELMQKAGEIQGFDTQYKVDIYAYDVDGVQVKLCSHKVDFRIHHNDGTYELLEAKGRETQDYKWRRMCLENFWLPEQPDYDYRVIKNDGYVDWRHI